MGRWQAYPARWRWQLEGRWRREQQLVSETSADAAHVHGTCAAALAAAAEPDAAGGASASGVSATAAPAALAIAGATTRAAATATTTTAAFHGHMPQMRQTGSQEEGLSSGDGSWRLRCLQHAIHNAVVGRRAEASAEPRLSNVDAGAEHV
jgi:hypothetical protein